MSGDDRGARLRFFLAHPSVLGRFQALTLIQGGGYSWGAVSSARPLHLRVVAADAETEGQ